MPAREVKPKLEQVRAYWAMRQGLSAPIKGHVDDVVRAAGWIYSAGSTLPYLAFRARLTDIDRAAIDRAIFQEERVLEIPTVRGCTMLIPAEDVGLALAAGRPFSTKHLEKIRKACEVTEREVRDLSAAVPVLLKDGPLSLETLRDRLPRRLVRDYGSSGRSLGERSTLTFVMRLLQGLGIVRRVAIDHRLDADSYTYRLMNPDLVRSLSQEETEDGLTRRFFNWAAPATLKEFSWWLGISQKDARKIFARVGLTSLSIEGWAREAWIPTEQMSNLSAARDEKNQPEVTLLPFRDNYLYFRRGIGALLDEADQPVEVLDWMGRPAALGEMKSLHHNAIIMKGRLVGFWEYDPDAGDIVWRTCSRLDGRAQREIEGSVAGMRAFIRGQLGDAAFYAFDSGINRRRRIDSLR